MPISSNEVTFCILSFEGPDRYARAGGIGVRVTHLAESLARQGFATHLLFVGDPDQPGRESKFDGALILHRWCRWISAHHPAGVYAGEEAKLHDFNASVPPFLIEEFIRPALEDGRLPVVLAEEWHTAEALIRLHDRLQAAGLRRRCILFWNANNTMSFHRVDWPRLNDAAQLTTVSRYMKHLMWDMGLNPLVIPNGIPAHLLQPVDAAQRDALRHTLDPSSEAIFLFKVGRFDPAKRWLMAVEAAALLKEQGHSVIFPLRGGIEPHGGEVLDRARRLGLTITHVEGNPNTPEEMLALLAAMPPADLYNLRFFMSQEMLRLFFTAADAVLANSGHEPFGLVGLEAMAAGGLVFTGITGEEYTLSGQSAVVLDTDRPEEIVSHILDLRAQPEQAQSLRRAAHTAASNFTWKKVTGILSGKVQFVAHASDAMAPRRTSHKRRVRDVVIYTVVHQPRRLRLPAQQMAPGASPTELARCLFDNVLNEHYFRKVAERCYHPATERFQALLDEGLKLSIGFSLSFIEQAQRWDRPLLQRFRRLVQHENVELVAVEPTHSFILLWDTLAFIERMRLAADRLQAIFGVRPVVADTTEMMMCDTIYYALERAGFEGGLVDGRKWVLGERLPTHVYHHGNGQLQLLVRHYDLSDDVGYRFSNRGWDGWPLMADTYAGWLADNPGDVVVLGWDYETFGEHHAAETGIFDFLEALPGEVHQAGLSFATASEAITRHGASDCQLPLPAFASTWAGSGGLEFFLGNDVQRAVFQLMIQAYNKARLSGDEELIELALWLAQSDNLHLIQWFNRYGAEAEVSAYFTPQEWWALGGDRIAVEIQQVYKNFITALDPYVGKGRGE